MSLQNGAKDFGYAMGAAGGADPAHTPASAVAPAVMNDLTNITNSHLHKRKRSENTTKKRPNNTKASFRMEANHTLVKINNSQRSKMLKSELDQLCTQLLEENARMNEEMAQMLEENTRMHEMCTRMLEEKASMVEENARKDDMYARINEEKERMLMTSFELFKAIKSERDAARTECSRNIGWRKLCENALASSPL
ncbi:hypothetical protein E3P84_00820 [Wallemia ichthyophaga]|uniref:Uncharacterized protein n=1 Tax=Wallemia ichthyophaga TaxID=245174 RepID=A0A4T0IMT3_WALIC|nr:hypothetical protein E3P86_03375 [Wallemia ichthyophaga]TIB36739.1 hypothetical protein E3P84_00820 [Wallemia ichthyophaga]TIB43014.1 hypothetical protein E3P83_00873 [Wallemia ichthyophaga]